MGNWSLIVPESTKNYLPNPSLETGVTGYTAYATGTADGTRARSIVWAKRDAWSYRIAKTSGGASDLYGFYVTAQLPGDFVTGEYCTFSVDLNVVSGTVQVYLAVVQGTTLTADTNATTDGRYSVTVGPLTATATEIKAYVYVCSETGEFYADGLQVENKAYATSYCDGTRKGCRWASIPHGSTSTRSDQERSGGKVVNLDDLGYYVTEHSGGGMPTLLHWVTELGILPGALLRGARAEARQLALVLTNTPSSLADLHSKRQALIDILKPDRTKKFEALWLRYVGANAARPVDLPVVYDAGLELGPLDGFTEEIGLRLIAYDPYWHEDGDVAQVLDEITWITSVGADGRVIQRKDGVWSVVSTALNEWIYAIAGSNGLIYFGGDFENVGDANGDGIVQYDPSDGSITSLGTGIPVGGVGDAVRAIAVAPNGDLYVGGQFANAGGVADTANLARWDVSAGEWQSFATSGANAGVFALAFDQDGALFVTGEFTQVDGVARARVAKYVISTDTWSSLGTGLSGAGAAIAISPNNVPYFGGGFVTANGVTVNNITYWNNTTFVAMGTTGVNSNVFDMAFGDDGVLYFCGAFTTCGGLSYAYVAGWNGAYIQLGSYWTASVYAIGFDQYGLLYAGDGTLAPRCWNGSTWSKVDLVVATASVLWRAFCLHNETFYVGYNIAADIAAAGQTTVNNTGKAEVYPRVVISQTGGGKASIKWLRNDTTGDAIKLGYALLDGETLTIDFNPRGRTCVSSMFGEVWRAIDQESDINTFRLLPGDNQISLLVYPFSGSPTVTAYVQWRNALWSLDGVAV